MVLFSTVEPFVDAVVGALPVAGAGPHRPVPARVPAPPAGR